MFTSCTLVFDATSSRIRRLEEGHWSAIIRVRMCVCACVHDCMRVIVCVSTCAFVYQSVECVREMV